MDIIQTLAGLLGFASFCLIPLGFLLAFVVIFLVIRKNKKSNVNRNDLRLNGITERAIVISARNNYATGTRSSGATQANVTFAVEVQPVNQPPFLAKFTELLPISADERFMWGERPGEAGKKVWVSYDPNNKSRMILDHYDDNHEWAMKRREFEKIDRRDERIRNNGQDAVAVILEAEDLNLATKNEKNSFNQSIWRLKLQVMPGKGEPYEGVTQGLFSNNGLQKYTAGKKVKVKINPQDKSQIALVGPADE